MQQIIWIYFTPDCLNDSINNKFIHWGVEARRRGGENGEGWSPMVVQPSSKLTIMCNRFSGAVPVTVRPPHPQNLVTTLPTVRMIVEVSKSVVVLSTSGIIKLLRSKVRILSISSKVTLPVVHLWKVLGESICVYFSYWIELMFWWVCCSLGVMVKALTCQLEDQISNPYWIVIKTKNRTCCPLTWCSVWEIGKGIIVYCTCKWESAWLSVWVCDPCCLMKLWMYKIAKMLCWVPWTLTHRDIYVGW